MYEFNSRVRYSEIDHHGTLTLPALINYFQDCSTFQSEDVGLGTEVLKAEKRAWILSYWQVIAERYPALGERITIGTFPTEFKGLFGNRNFYLKDESGNMIAKAYSVWVFLDTETGRPVRPEEKDIKHTAWVRHWICLIREEKSPYRKRLRHWRHSRYVVIILIRMSM